MKPDWDKMTRDFLLGEGMSVTMESRIQTLSELLGNMKPKSATEQRRLQVAMEQIHEIKKGYKKMLEEQKAMLEQLNVLKEQAEEARVLKLEQ